MDTLNLTQIETERPLWQTMPRVSPALATLIRPPTVSIQEMAVAPENALVPVTGQIPSYIIESDQLQSARTRSHALGRDVLTVRPQEATLAPEVLPQTLPATEFSRSVTQQSAAETASQEAPTPERWQEINSSITQLSNLEPASRRQAITALLELTTAQQNGSAEQSVTAQMAQAMKLIKQLTDNKKSSLSIEERQALLLVLQMLQRMASSETAASVDFRVTFATGRQVATRPTKRGLFETAANAALQSFLAIGEMEDAALKAVFGLGAKSQAAPAAISTVQPTSSIWKRFSTPMETLVQPTQAAQTRTKSQTVVTPDFDWSSLIDGAVNTVSGIHLPSVDLTRFFQKTNGAKAAGDEEIAEGEFVDLPPEQLKQLEPPKTPLLDYGEILRLTEGRRSPTLSAPQEQNALKAGEFFGFPRFLPESTEEQAIPPITHSAKPTGLKRGIIDPTKPLIEGKYEVVPQGETASVLNPFSNSPLKKFAQSS